MQTHQLQDRQDLNDLMNGWMHRDLGEWEQLRNLFIRTAQSKLRGSKGSRAILSRVPCVWALQICAQNI